MIPPEVVIREIEAAEQRIRPDIRTTDVIETGLAPGRRVHLKLENTQYTGSFKARGSLNKVRSLTPDEKSREIVAASTGNHGLGVARALQLTGQSGTIFLPEYTQPQKIAALKEYGVRLEIAGKTWNETEALARQVVKERGATWLSPYNDLQVIGGQGTIGIELKRQMDVIDRIFLTVGGGGMASGVGTMLKSVFPDIHIVGCLPANSPEMYLSVREGHIVNLDSQKDTLSDGSAGGIEEGAITFPICQSVIDEFRLVSEEEIVSAMQSVYRRTGQVIEGASGVAVAAYLQDENPPKGTDVVLICGGNISRDKFEALMQ